MAVPVGEGSFPGSMHAAGDGNCMSPRPLFLSSSVHVHHVDK